MKRIFFAVLTAAAILSSTACSDFLEEDTRGKLSGEDVLKSVAGLESALTGAYRGWTNCWTYGFSDAKGSQMTAGGDDYTCPVTVDISEYDRLRVLSTDASMAPVFWGCYKAIQGANNILLNYENTVGNADAIKAIAGEAYFIRAFSYFWLVRCHGEIPLILTADYSTEVVNIKKSSVKEIYQLIEDDLLKAESMLSDSKRDEGRPNAGSAKALLAEVYLAEAGWPLKDQSKYAQAAAKAKEVIDNHFKYGFELLGSYAELFENDDTKNCINAEDVFIIPSNRYAGNTSNINYGLWAMPGEVGGWDCCYTELRFYNDFPEGPRKEATFATVVKKKDGTEIFWQDLKFKRPLYKKLFMSENSPNYYDFNSSLPIRLLRYAQTVLTYAEAKARSGGPDVLAYECLNSIRKRAGLEEYSNLSAEEFADVTVQERAWELCAERVRWFDMVRLEIVAEVFAQRDPSENQPYDSNITEACYTYPLPEHDILINQNMK